LAQSLKETNVNNILNRLLIVALALSLLIGCVPITAPVDVVEEAPAEESAVIEEASGSEEQVAEAATEMAAEEDLDAAFSDLLNRMAGYNTISLEDANLALFEEPVPFLLDVRNVEEAEEKGHIEGAVLVPLRELGQNLDLLPAFDDQMIVYCGSGWRATIAMTALEALGWNNVDVLKDGSFGGWVEAGYPSVEGVPPAPEVLDAAQPDPQLAAELEAMIAAIPEGWAGVSNEDLNLELIENSDLILVDVRRPEERAEKGIIDTPGEQIAIPLETFVADKSLWPADKDASIVVYCGSGHRSTMGMSILRSYGYSDVRSLKGGFSAWAEAGYPVAEEATP
jgi:rhodanese-related sulfurtransferase